MMKTKAKTRSPVGAALPSADALAAADDPTTPEAAQAFPASPLSGLVYLEEYQKSRSHVFPSLNSLRWFISENREGLLAADALRQLSGRLMPHAERMDRFVDSIGKRAAERRFKASLIALQEVEAPTI
jgi:hypothetical protein